MALLNEESNSNDLDPNQPGEWWALDFRNDVRRVDVLWTGEKHMLVVAYPPAQQPPLLVGIDEVFHSRVDCVAEAKRRLIKEMDGLFRRLQEMDKG